MHPIIAQVARGRFHLQALLSHDRNHGNSAADRFNPEMHFSADEMVEISRLPVMQRIRMLAHASERDRYTDFAEMRMLLPRSDSVRDIYRDLSAKLGNRGFTDLQILELADSDQHRRRFVSLYLDFLSTNGFSVDNIMLIVRANADRRSVVAVQATQLMSMGWTPDDIAHNRDASRNRNGYFQLGLPPYPQQERARRRLEESQAQFLAQQSALAARRPLVEPGPPALDATQRWAHDPQKTTASEAQAFSDQVFPRALRRRLKAATDVDSRNLLMLVAGLTFTADYRDTARRAGLIERTKRVLAYIKDAQDPELLRDCKLEATGTIECRGDRLSLGLTRIEQTVECHRMVRGDVSPAEVFKGVRRHFNQMLVEARAVELAGSDNGGESVDVYSSLAQGLARKGVQLEESAQASLEGESSSFAVSDQASKTYLR